MKDETVTDALLREFLLGKVGDEDRERIESLFLTDSQVKERILVAEQELIDDYVDGSLTTEDSERFLSVYEQTAEQRQEIRITKSLKEWAAKQASSSSGHASAASTVAVHSSGWSRILEALRQRPVVPIAAMIVIAIVVAVVWLNNLGEQRNRQHLAIEQELARLNTPESLRETPPQMVSRELSPVTVRSGEEQPEIRIGAETRTVELRLPWLQNERFATYQAEIRRIGNDESFTIRNLHAQTDGGYALRLRLPARILSRGQYQVRLRGINADGSASAPAEYQFSVDD
jgi:hypothetical protein